MSASFRPSVTRADLRLARLPTGAARQRLRTIGHRAAEIFHGLARDLPDPMRRRRAGLLAELTDSLGLALNEVSCLERELASARVQIGQLQQENARLESEAFNVVTRTRDTRDLLPLTSRTAQLAAPDGSDQ